jgi:hypothetical protein
MAAAVTVRAMSSIVAITGETAFLLLQSLKSFFCIIKIDLFLALKGYFVWTN